MSEDKELKQWKEKLFYQPKNGYDRIDAEQTGEIFAYAEGYKQFLDAARTEREAVKEAIRMAEAEGFVPYTFGMELQPGSKVYVNNRGKALMLAVLGQQPLDQGDRLERIEDAVGLIGVPQLKRGDKGVNHGLLPSAPR